MSACSVLGGAALGAVSGVEVMGTWCRIALYVLLTAGVASTQEVDLGTGLTDPVPAARTRAIRQIGNSPLGPDYLDRLAPLLGDDVEGVRLTVVAALVRMRSVDALPLLVDATRDSSPRVQAMAVDGLVDFYSPNYAKQGQMGSLSSYSKALRNRFVKPNPLTVPAYVNVSTEVTAAIGDVARQGHSIRSRTNAARAIGILLARDQLGALLEGVRSRDGDLIMECVLALRKLQEISAGPDIVFLLRDLDPNLQLAVVQTVGQLRTPEAVPELVRIIDDTSRRKIRIEALIALAKIPRNGQRDLFISYSRHRDDAIRAAAIEGLGRLGNPVDRQLVGELMAKERSPRARLSMAFALVLYGDRVRVAVLVEGLESRLYQLEARPLLQELARDPAILAQLYVPLATGSPPQRRHLAVVIGESGTAESVPYLESLTEDSNGEVATAAIEALRTLRARL